MDAAKKKRITRVILERLDAATQYLRENDEQAPVILDQQSVGRLSRMDAMQRQAMAKETARRRDAEVRRLRAALARLEDGDFGCCAECGEDIPFRRLEIDPGATVCVACASGD